MTRFEKITKRMSVEQLALFLCDMLEDYSIKIEKQLGEEINFCDACPGTDRCSGGSNGLIRWLGEEADDEG